MDMSKEPKMQDLLKTIEQSGFDVYEILNAMGYYGFKLWSDEDVQATLTNVYQNGNSLPEEWIGEDGRPASVKDIGLSIAGVDKGLSSCTDNDWALIEDYILREAGSLLKENTGTYHLR